MNMHRSERARTTLLNHPNIVVLMSGGIEGPAHDPYGYEEVTVRTPKVVLTFHQGLGDWVVYNTTPIELKGFSESERSSFIRNELVKQVTGYTMTQLERFARKRSERCHNCGSKRFECVSGMPGETFTICSECKEVADTCFDLSAVI